MGTRVLLASSCTRCGKAGPDEVIMAPAGMVLVPRHWVRIEGTTYTDDQGEPWNPGFDHVLCADCGQAYWRWMSSLEEAV